MSDAAADFIAFIMSAEGQAVIEANGYIAVVEDAPAFAGGKLSSKIICGKIVIAGSSSVTPVLEKLAEAYEAINPGVEIQEINEFYLPENHDLFFGGRLDYIVDAIDTVKSKIDLIVEADRRGIPIISSMGAGNKLNPAQLEVSDIYKTSVCPLARALRQKLKKLGIRKLKVVYSKEEPLKPMVIEGHTEEPPGSRHTVPGSVSFVPSVAGLIAASEVVKDLVKARASDRLQS